MASDSDVGHDPIQASDRENDPWAPLRGRSDPAEFARHWLELQVGIIGAGVRQGVVVLGDGKGGALSPVAVWPEGTLGSPALVSAIEAAIARSETVTIGGRRAATPANKLKVDAIACPLIVDEQVCGAVGLEVEHCPAEKQREIAAQLGWGAAWLKSLVLRSRYALADRLVAVIELAATALHYERFAAAATAVATELAVALSCERVSIGFLRGRNVKLAVMSHSSAFGKKANIVRAIEAAMDEAVDQQATVTFPSAQDGPLQVTGSHEKLVTEHGAGPICTVPLAQGERMLGAITLERPREVPFDSASIELCEHVAALMGPLLDVKRREDRWLGAKAVDSARETARKLIGPRNVALKLLTSGALLLLLFFAFAKGEYRVTVDARIEGAVQRAITTPIAGYVADAKFRAGDIVAAGDELFALDDRELTLERVKWSSQKAQYSREYQAAVATHDRAQASVLAAQIEQAEAQIELVEEQLKRIRGVAPFAGIVVSGDLSQSLGAPVERGDILFEIAPLDAYRVILKVEERDIGEVRVGQAGELVLTGMPSKKFAIVVRNITPVSVAEEGVNYFRVEAALQEASLAALRPGMEGVGKVEVDERRIVWIWTYKVVHWLRMFFWSWWP